MQWIKGRKITGISRKLTDRQMYYAVKKYKEECENKRFRRKIYKAWGHVF